MAEEQTGVSVAEGYTLAFDASAQCVSFCLWEGDEVRRRWASVRGEVLAEELPSRLASEMAQGGKGFSFRLLRRICFVRGPGSYTGLRASLSVARGLRLACSGLRLYSVTSFEAGLLSCREGGRVLSLVESFRSVWYGQLFEGGVALGEARVLDDDALRLWVFTLLEEEELRFCGGGAERASAEVLGSFARGEVAGGGEAYDFGRPLVQGQGQGKREMYAQGEKALQPIYMSAPV